MVYGFSSKNIDSIFIVGHDFSASQIPFLTFHFLQRGRELLPAVIFRYMLLTELPSYMSGILGFDMKENALVSALPFLVMWLYSMLFGGLMDWLESRGRLTRTGITKLSTAIGEDWCRLYCQGVGGPHRLRGDCFFISNASRWHCSNKKTPERH